MTLKHIGLGKFPISRRNWFRNFVMIKNAITYTSTCIYQYVKIIHVKKNNKLGQSVVIANDCAREDEEEAKSRKQVKPKLCFLREFDSQMKSRTR